jgi:nucleoside-diphosphate-sugar epimerase
MAPHRLLLTGATGFVGRHVLTALPTELELHCVSRNTDGAENAIWHQVDLRDSKAVADLIREVQPTHLAHLAWNTEHGKFWHAQDNIAWRDAGIEMTSAFAECGGRRLIIAGTGAEYTADAVSPINELSNLLSPATLYGQAKRDLFLAARDIAAAHKVSFSWPRIFNAYGEGEPAGRLVPSIINAILRGEPAKCSSGIQQRDFVDTRDLGSAIAKLIFSGVEGPINLGSGQDATIGDIARQIGDLMDRSDLIALGALPDREGEPVVQVPDLKRMREDLKYKPKINHKRGLQDAIDWWCAKLSA